MKKGKIQRGLHIVKMETWLIILIGLAIAFVIGFFIEPVRDFYEEMWENIVDAFSNSIEALSNLEDSPLTNVWFWAFYICLLAAVWILPAKTGLADYKLSEKIMYTIIFFIVDWILISHFQNS